MTYVLIGTLEEESVGRGKVKRKRL